MPTKIIDNFAGRLVRDNIGDMNSGLAKFGTTFGNEPFSNPGNLTWYETPIQIDPSGSVITDLILAGKERVESGISYVYAIGHTGRLYKIQVNDPSSYNPNYDNPVLLTTLTINSPTFTRGASLDFYGATEKIYIGHDMGVTSINFNGSSEAFVGVLGSWTQNVPRPFQQFVGSLFVGNSSNLAQIDSTATVISYGKLSPGFPTNTQVRDIDLTPDGVYLEAVVSRLALPDITLSTQDTTFLSNSESYIFKWNGTDTGYTSFNTYPSFSLNANIMFGNYQYTFGYDLAGCAVFNPIKKILTPILNQAPLPNAISSNANVLGWMAPEFVQGFLKGTQFLFGPLDFEYQENSWYRPFQASATGTETDVIRMPFTLIVSNLVIGASTNGYFRGTVGVGKQYFSTLEASSAPTTKYKFYKFINTPIGTGTTIGGVYETQQETSFKLFRSIITKKFKCTNVRFYTAPLIANNSFKIDLIGSDGNPITGGSQTFTVGSGNVIAGQDFLWYTPQMSPTYSLGVRITNLGSVNWTGVKLELDYEEEGN